MNENIIKILQTSEQNKYENKMMYKLHWISHSHTRIVIIIIIIINHIRVCTVHDFEFGMCFLIVQLVWFSFYRFSDLCRTLTHAYTQTHTQYTLMAFKRYRCRCCLIADEVKSRFVHSLHATLDMLSMWFWLIKWSSLLCAPSELTQFSS